METCSFYVVTQVAVPCSKLCHLEDKDVTKFTILTEKRKKINIGNG
jgi:hypothetical protein